MRMLGVWWSGVERMLPSELIETPRPNQIDGRMALHDDYKRTANPLLEAISSSNGRRWMNLVIVALSCLLALLAGSAIIRLWP
jgi:hypothetical protein